MTTHTELGSFFRYIFSEFNIYSIGYEAELKTPIKINKNEGNFIINDTYMIEIQIPELTDQTESSIPCLFNTTASNISPIPNNLNKNFSLKLREDSDLIFTQIFSLWLGENPISNKTVDGPMVITPIKNWNPYKSKEDIKIAVNKSPYFRLSYFYWKNDKIKKAESLNMASNKYDIEKIITFEYKGVSLVNFEHKFNSSNTNPSEIKADFTFTHFTVIKEPLFDKLTSKALSVQNPFLI